MANFDNFDVTGGSNNLDITFSAQYLHDASGYYNYEQDNIPLRRLISRTDLLHQFAGYPGDEDSKATTLVLSSTADEANGIFDNMTDIVKRIPQRLTFPLLIELADYGDLGSLNLRDITTFGNGQLEIKNLLHGFEYNASATSVSSVNGLTDNEQITNPTGATSTGNALVTVSSLDLTNGFMSQLIAASTSRGSTNVFDASLLSATDANRVANSTVFATVTNSTDLDIDKLYFSKGAVQNSTYALDLTPYQGVYDNTIPTDDIAPRKDSGGGDNLEFDRTQISLDASVGISVYGNFFRGVTLNNCNGSIKLTNVCVDGASGLDNTADALSHNTSHGFDITNSEVILQNCASARNRINSYRVRNSDIFVAGNMYGYRSYQRETSKSRTTSYESAGLYAENSNVIFADSALGITGDADFNRFHVMFAKSDYGIRLKKSVLEGGTKLQSGSVVPNAGDTDTQTSIIATFQNKKSGIFLDGSESTYFGRLNSFNNKRGLRCLNSTLTVNQFTFEDCENEGVFADASRIIYGYREDESTNSNLPDSSTGKKRTTFNVSNNGINLRVVRNSALEPYDAEDVAYPDYIGKWGGREADTGVTGSNAMVSHGSTSQSSAFRNLPSIYISDASIARFLNLAVVRGADGVGPGRCVLAERDSNVYIHGTSVSPTVFSMTAAGATWTNAELFPTWNSAAVTADYNSNVTLTGRTKITRFGVGTLALNGSRVQITTPSRYGADSPDTTKFGLTTAANQTQVQIHSTRSCMVASKNSGIILDNIGGSPDSYSNSDGQSSDIRYNTSATGSAAANGTLWDAATSEAYIQFFPNGFAKAIATGDTKAVYNNNAALNRTVATGGVFIASGSHDDATTGGMVIRATNGSYVDVDSVNFLFAVPASSLSGVAYNYTGSANEFNGIEPGCELVGAASDGGVLSGVTYPPNLGDTLGDASSWQFSYSGFDECFFPPLDGSAYELSAYGTKTHMWNIADTSRIVAKNILINTNNSFLECSSNNYHGPSGKWRNGVALDYYGLWGTATTYHAAANNKFRNYGPYRLHLSHRGDIKSYYGVSGMNRQGSENQTTVFGQTGAGAFIDQVNSQGYQFFTAQAKPFDNGDGQQLYWIRPSQLSEGSIQGYLQVSGADSIFGMGMPSPYSGVASFIQPPIAAYQARKYFDTYNFDSSNNVSAAPTDDLVSLMQATPGFAIPPVHMDWQGYLRNWLDDSASNLFANSRHLAMKQVNGVSIFHSTNSLGGEGRGDDAEGVTYGLGVRSLNLFDLDNLL